jgi:hypothetical protein
MVKMPGVAVLVAVRVQLLSAALALADLSKTNCEPPPFE